MGMFPIFRPAVFLAALPFCTAQEAPDATAMLREELRAMRADYEARIRQLEDRLAELEKAPAGGMAKAETAPEQPNDALTKPDSPAIAAETEARRERARARFAGGTEIQDLALEDRRAERIETVLEDFVDINGYFRAGYGKSDAGGPQRAFGIPGVGGTKYRLGNETENYGELAFAKTFFLPGTFAPGGTAASPEDGPLARVVARLSFYNPYSDYGAGLETDFAAPEVWASIGNILAAQPDMKIWAGNRFYRRHDIHINDFYFYNMSGGGAGIEDLAVGPGKLAFAWMGDGEESTIYEAYRVPDPSNVAGFSKSTLDLRYYDFAFLGGQGEIGIAYSMAESGVDADGRKAGDAGGAALNLVRVKEGFLDKNSLHKSSLQIGTGPAKTFTSGFDTFTTDQGTFIRPDPEDTWRVRFTDQWVVKPAEQWSLGTGLVYQYTDFGGGLDQHWASFGARPILHLTPSFGIAFEAGLDYVSATPEGNEGFLGKFTLAPQFSLGDEFFSRPVIRGFLSYGIWSDGLSGEVGGPDYDDAASGWTYGVQMESWW